MQIEQQVDAIQQDVSTEEQQTLTSPESPRARALAIIEEKNRLRMEEEMGVSLAEPEPEPEPDQVEQQLADPEPAPAQKYKVKVDGQELEVPIEDLVRTYQKNTAADRRLEEAARILRESQELAAQESQPQQNLPEPDEDLRTEAAKMLADMYEGNQEAATEAMVKLLSRAKGGDQPTPQPTIDPDQLTAQVLERMALNTAFERVKTDYPDIIADPNLEALAAMQINQQVQAGIPRSDAMLSVADSLYKSLGKTPTGRQQTTSQQRSTRQENKERLDPVPSASAAAVAPVSPMEANNPSALIQEMAKRRLGQTLPG